MQALFSSGARRLGGAAILLALACTPAQAQLGLLRTPQLSLPQPLGSLEQDLLRRPATRLLNMRELDGPLKLIEQRLSTVQGLLQRHPAHLEADHAGEPVVRQEILAWSPSAAGLAHASALGMTVVRQHQPSSVDRWVVLQVPARLGTAEALAQLQQRDPDGDYDFNHIYTGSGATTGTAARPAGAATTSNAAARPASAAISASATASESVAVGLIDSGVDASHLVFSASHLQQWGCDGKAHPAHHGTAVAALMVGESLHFRGVAPQARLYAADVYCDSPSGGSVDKIVQAMAWFSAQGVAVINLSLVGPPNRMLERAVAALVGRGHVLVAAAGNDGPAAPPLYPAAYPGVVAVSAVDPHGKLLPESARGPHIVFAAPGSKMVSATTGTPPYRQVRGSSFAAPVVAALLAQSLQQPDPAQARRAVDALAQRAVKGGSELGHGMLGREFRNDPTAFR